MIKNLSKEYGTLFVFLYIYPCENYYHFEFPKHYQ